MLISRVIAGTLALLVSLTTVAGAEPPADRVASLRRGVNLTNWFRYPASLAPGALRAYLGDPAIDELRDAGVQFVRLAVQPALLPALTPILVEQIARLQRHGLAVIVALHPAAWHPEQPADQARLRATWQALAPALASLDPRRTLPEPLNEPVFAGDAAGWQALQHTVLAVIRAALPEATVVLTGADWGSTGGLLALAPESDPNVIYSVHLYDPVELTSLAAWRPGLDRAALARLPFPATEPAACAAAVGPTDPDTGGVVRFYCAQHWDAARVAVPLDAAAGWASRHHATLLLGEFGASAQLNPAARLAWLRAVRTASERDGIGWALWGYDDAMGFGAQGLDGLGSAAPRLGATNFGVARPPGARPPLDPAVLRALGLRPPS